MKLVQCVNASDFPEDVEIYCQDNDIATHYETGLYNITDDGNPLSEWLKSEGYEFKKGVNWVGIWGS